MVNSIDKLVSMFQKGTTSEKIQVLEEIIDRYSPYIEKYVLRFCNDYETAENICQETFINVWSSLDKFKWKGEYEFNAWLLTIAKNKLVDDLRKKRKTKLLEDCDKIDWGWHLESINTMMIRLQNFYVIMVIQTAWHVL